MMRCDVVRGDAMRCDAMRFRCDGMRCDGNCDTIRLGYDLFWNICKVANYTIGIRLFRVSFEMLVFISFSLSVSTRA